jgi:predicted molibdopterin-dependent oxidoreductase YjgC
LAGLFALLARMVGGEATLELDGLNKKLVDQLPRLTQELREAHNLVVLVGPETLCHPNNAAILESVERLAHLTGAAVIPLAAHGNLAGSFLIGAYPELLPGGYATANAEQRRRIGQRWGRPLPEPIPAGQPQVLYLIGVRPPATTSATVIYQNIDQPCDGQIVDLALPAAAFSEADGTLVNYTGQVLELRRAAPPPGDALPSWQILCRIARALSAPGFDFTSAAEIRAEMAGLIKGYQPNTRLSLETLNPAFSEPAGAPEPKIVARGKWPFILTTRVTANTYLGHPLTRRVEGLRALFPEEALCINPEDAQQAGIASGEAVLVRAPQFEKIWPARLDPRQQPGTLLVTLKRTDSTGPVITPAEIRKAYVQAD